MSSILRTASEFRKDDPVGRLICHYFQPCEFCREEYSRVSQALAKQKQRTRFRAAKEITFLRLWLASLYTVAEGFRELALSDERINALLMDEDNLVRLRRFRNGTFHYQQTADKLTQLFDGHTDALPWAELLYVEFHRFFREYRVDMTVANLMAATRQPPLRPG